LFWVVAGEGSEAGDRVFLGVKRLFVYAPVGWPLFAVFRGVCDALVWM
jgi:hypothetical protein